MLDKIAEFCISLMYQKIIESSLNYRIVERSLEMAGKNLSDLCRRYNQKQNTMSMFISKYRNEIDPDGTHIIRSGRNVYFDSFAVAKIDELRNYTPGVILAEEHEADPMEIIMLHQKLEAASTENSELKDEIIRLLRKSNETELLLAEEQKKTALLTAGGNQYIAEIEAKEKQIEELKDENARLRSRPVVVDRRAGSRWRWRH